MGTVEAGTTVETDPAQPNPRRAVIVAAASFATVAALVIGAAFWMGRAEPADPVSVVGVDPGGPPVPVGSTEPLPNGGLVVTPATGLADGQEVNLTLAEPVDRASGQSVLVAQCSSEVGDLLSAGGSMAVLDWCNVYDGLDGRPAGDIGSVQVRRILETESGPVDCAERPGRCLVAARVGSVNSTDDRWGAIEFRSDVEPAGPPSVEVIGLDGPVPDGTAVEVTMDGLLAGERVSIRQCTRPPGWPLGGDRWAQVFCDTARTMETTVAGARTVSVTVFHDVLSWSEESDAEGWAPCERCALVVSGGHRRQPLAVVAVEIEPTAHPIRPTIELRGEVVAGGTVDGEVNGLQPGQSVVATWCLGLVQGGGAGRCDDRVDVAVTGSASVEGTWALDRFVLPDSSAVVAWSACDDSGPGCGVGLVSDPGGYFEPFAYLPVT